MATFTGKAYGKAYLALWNKEIDWDSDTISVIATTSSHTIDQDAHDYVDDITNEVSGGSYARKTLGTKTTTYTGGSNKHALDGADLQWTTATFTFRHLHVASTTAGSDATRPLIGYQSGDGDTTGGGGNLDFAWNASGIIEETVG